MDTPDIDEQGERLMRRAASPGVTHGGLPVRRMAIGGGASLASEIQRRWAPAAEAGWGSGPALHYGGPGAAAGAPAMPTVQASPAGSAPRVRTVGEVASPAVQAAASMGASLQRQHLGTPVAERTPGTAGTPGTPRTPGTGTGPLPVVQRQAAESVAAGSTPGPAIVRRSSASPAGAPAMPLRQESAAVPAPLSRAAGEGRGGGAPAAPASSAMGPAIVRRSQASSPAAAPAMPLRQESAPLSREAGEGRGGRAPAPAAAAVQASPSVTMGPAIIHRSAVGSAAARPLTPSPSPIAHPPPGKGEPAPSLPLSRSGGGKGRPQAGEGQGVRGSGSVQRSAAPAPPAFAPVPTPSLTASAAGLSMPLARSAAAPATSGSAPASSSNGGVIQRQAIGGGSGEASSSEASAAEDAAPVAGGGSSAGPDVEEVVERVMRRLTRTLAVESERQGGRRWPYRS